MLGIRKGNFPTPVGKDSLQIAECDMTSRFAFLKHVSSIFANALIADYSTPFQLKVPSSILNRILSLLVQKL